MNIHCRIIPLKCAVIMLLLSLPAGTVAVNNDGNRLTYLDEADPFYVHVDFPKLTTRQWVGEPGVEAVVTFGIDDLSGNHGNYEQFLRPLLERLKEIDGRAPVSIFSNNGDPAEPQYQSWLREGVTLEVHTLTHPCPILAGNDFDAAFDTFHGGVRLFNEVPNNAPVAFRTPCCDSLNTPSPRMFAEIFNRVNSEGQYLQLDSSVFNVTTKSDATLPSELVTDPGGVERFRKYIPFESYVVTVENYPYPYVIGNLIWEFPCMVPSDWEAQHLHGNRNPKTLEDWKAAIDVTVLKQGTFNLVFHPHGWIGNDQMVDLVEYAVKRHGSKVKFLNFKEAAERLQANLLGGQALRGVDGQDNGVRVIDLNADGYMDVVIGNEQLQQTRVWDPEREIWVTSGFPVQLISTDEGKTYEAGVRFGILKSNGLASFFVASEGQRGIWHFDGRKWVRDAEMLTGLGDGKAIFTVKEGRDQGVRFRDINGDGLCELLVSNPEDSRILAWASSSKRWKRLEYTLPGQISIVDEAGRDNGLRFVDLNDDGLDDIIFSNAERYAAFLFERKGGVYGAGWTVPLRSGTREDPEAVQIPMIVRSGAQRNNGAWFHSQHLWIQNENTAHLPNLVDRRSYVELANTNATLRVLEHPENIHVEAGSKAMFRVDVEASGGDAKRLVYQWHRDEQPIPGATQASLTMSSLTEADDGAVFFCDVFFYGKRARTEPASLKVLPDRTPPRLYSATGMRRDSRLTLAYNEKIDTETGADPGKYRLSGGVRVVKAEMLFDGQSVLLTLTEPIQNAGSLLQVQGVRDLSGNVMESSCEIPIRLAEWKIMDLGGNGDPSIASVVESIGDGAFRVKAAGSDFWGQSDHGNFIFQEQTGDFDLQVQVEDFEGGSFFAKAGLMVREAGEAGSRQFGIFCYPTRAVWISTARGHPGGESTDFAQSIDWAAQGIEYPHTWIRIRREGGTFRSFWSKDGLTWTAMVQFTPDPPFASAVLAGAATCGQSNDEGQMATAVYRNLSTAPQGDGIKRKSNSR